MLLDSIGSVVPGLKNPEGSLFLHQIAWAKGPTKPIKGFWEQKDTESFCAVSIKAKRLPCSSRILAPGVNFELPLSCGGTFSCRMTTRKCTFV